jgi:tRNA(Arg) A34 adenosine deaminase TadA
VQPCFFIAGPSGSALSEAHGRSLPDALNHGDMTALRTAIRTGERAECKTCVCSLWRDP